MLIVEVPVKGDMMTLDDVQDEVFSSRAMGEGLAVYPTEGQLYAPVSGEIVTVFPTGHALGIKTTYGTELLIHIGLNTVDLEKGIFDISVKSGEIVTKGQKIGSFDLEGIKERGFDPTTMLVFTSGIKEERFKVVDRNQTDITKLVINTELEGVVQINE